MEVCLAKEGGVSGNWQKVHFVDVGCIHIIVVIVCYSQSAPLADFAYGGLVIPAGKVDVTA